MPIDPSAREYRALALLWHEEPVWASFASRRKKGERTVDVIRHRVQTVKYSFNWGVISASTSRTGRDGSSVSKRT